VTRLVTVPAAADPAWSGAAPDPATSNAPWHIYNVGNSRPVEVLDLVALIEQAVGKRAIRQNLPMQPGDVLETSADCGDLERAVGFRPSTSIEDGIARFVEWFHGYRRAHGA
jgi:UDP-glucuronate 4-epimerase